VLRRIEAGSFEMGGSYNVTLTKTYYIGIFEMTQHQWILVRGNNPVNDYKGDMRPVHEVSYDMIRGSSNGSKWPSSNSVDSGSFMGRMRSRTGLLFDLPTEAQWEYACRAGTTSKYNNGGNGTVDLTKLGRWHDNCDDGKGGISYNVQPTTVGLYQSNAWGLYDMHGNTWECCLDFFGDLSSGVDPKGPLSGMIGDTLGISYRVLRGGYFLGDVIECTSSYRTSFNPHSAGSNHYYYYGFRVCLTLQ
jgi:formylglycine-generating enzyme required for sulfatase activity